MKHTVTMTSEAFGTETFQYATAKEARQGATRLKKSARAYQKKDGIKRTITITT